MMKQQIKELFIKVCNQILKEGIPIQKIKACTKSCDFMIEKIYFFSCNSIAEDDIHIYLKSDKFIITISHIKACFENTSFHYKCFEKEPKKEIEGLLDAIIHGEGIKLKIIWELKIENSFKELGKLKHIKCFIPKLTIQLKKVDNQNIFDSISLNLCADEIRKEVAITLIDKFKKEIPTKINNELNDILKTRCNESQREILEKTILNDKKQKIELSSFPDKKWTHEWYFLEEPKNVQITKENFEKVFINTIRKH